MILGLKTRSIRNLDVARENNRRKAQDLAPWALRLAPLVERKKERRNKSVSSPQKLYLKGYRGHAYLAQPLRKNRTVFHYSLRGARRPYGPEANCERSELRVAHLKSWKTLLDSGIIKMLQ